MATKKAAYEKPATKKGRKGKAVNRVASVLEIQIMPNGDVAQTAYLDPSGKKHPPKIYWAAIDTSQQYQVELDSPPCPFKEGDDSPFPTDASGRTETLTTDKRCRNGDYGYTVSHLTARGRWRRLSAADIIIDG